MNVFDQIKKKNKQKKTNPRAASPSLLTTTNHGTFICSNTPSNNEVTMHRTEFPPSTPYPALALSEAEDYKD